MGRVIAFSSFVAALGFLTLRLTSSAAPASPHLSATDAVLAGSFFTLAIAAMLRD
ncbi:MAG TPA: hypothetical protein VKS78_12265 [Roseiarcus sp.]|nr:hypothetical protein [Roseiarcus sp.]